MNKDDLFLKVDIVTYYPLENVDIRQEKAKEGNQYFVNGKLVEPRIVLFDEQGKEIDFDSESCGIEIVTREKMWADEPDLKIFDEVKQSFEKEKSKEE